MPPPSKLEQSESVLRSLVERGHTDREIAAILGATYHTVYHTRIRLGLAPAGVGDRGPDNRRPGQPPPVSDADHERWLRGIRAAEARRDVWVPREANC